MKDVIEQSFKISLTVLRYFGAYSFEKSSNTMKMCILIPYFLAMSVVVLTFVNLLVQENHNITEINLSIVFLLETTNICIRIALFFIFSEKIRNCVHYFEGRSFAPKDEEEKRMIENCVRTCHRNSKIFATTLMLTIFLWCLFPFLKKERVLSANIWLPYDFSSGYLAYDVTSLYVDIACVYLACFGCIDPLMGGLIHHATTQLTILKYNLKNLHKIDGSFVKFENVFIVLGRCIEHHDAILKFIIEFEDCFSWVIFSQIGASTLGLCFCCIGITLVDMKSPEVIQYILTYVIMAGQILFSCYYGTLLYEESKSLNEAIYSGPWYISDVKTRKVLIILMERSKRPIVITAGKITELTLETLTAVIKTSYSLIAVFKRY